MRRYSPAPYYSPPRRGYGSPPPRRDYDSPPRREYSRRERSPPPRRGYGGGGRGGRGRGGGGGERRHGSLLVRNIPLDCRPEELRVPFERFGPVRDVYIPKDYYSGQPRGFAFIEFVDPYDATSAHRSMNGRTFAGKEISVVLASESRKRPEEMRTRTRGSSRDYGGRPSSHYGRSASRSVSRSRSPVRPGSRSRYRSRSYSPAPRRGGGGGYSVSPPRKNEDRPRSPRGPPREQDDDYNRRSYSPADEITVGRDQDGKGFGKKPSRDSEKGGRGRSPPGRSPPGRSPPGRSPPRDSEKGGGRGSRSPPHIASRSPSGSRSRSADLSPGPSR